MTLEEIELIRKRYTDLLIRQYYDKPKAKATIEMYVDLFLQKGIPFDITKIFDIDQAVGKQLDLIGKLVGVDRSTTGLVLKDRVFFSLGDGLVNPTAKYKSFGDGIITGEFINEGSVLSREIFLGDKDYRLLIKLKIATKHIANNNYSEYIIENTLFDVFGNDIEVSTGIMSITYKVRSTINRIVNVALYKQILPKPMGVKLIIDTL